MRGLICIILLTVLSAVGSEVYIHEPEPQEILSLTNSLEKHYPGIIYPGDTIIINNLSFVTPKGGCLWETAETYLKLKSYEFQLPLLEAPAETVETVSVEPEILKSDNSYLVVLTTLCFLGIIVIIFLIIPKKESQKKLFRFLPERPKQVKLEEPPLPEEVILDPKDKGQLRDAWVAFYKNLGFEIKIPLPKSRPRKGWFLCYRPADSQMTFRLFAAKAEGKDNPVALGDYDNGLNPTDKGYWYEINTGKPARASSWTELQKQGDLPYFEEICLASRALRFFGSRFLVEADVSLTRTKFPGGSNVIGYKEKQKYLHPGCVRDIDYGEINETVEGRFVRR